MNEEQKNILFRFGQSQLLFNYDRYELGTSSEMHNKFYFIGKEEEEEVTVVVKYNN